MLSAVPIASRFQLLGEVVALCMNSRLHSRYAVNDLTNNLLPPLDLGQFRLYKRADQPVGLVTWAYLDEVTEARYSQQQYDLRLHDWNKGDRLWFIDFILSADIMPQIEHDLKHRLFAEHTAKALRADASGRVYKVQEYHGARYRAPDKDRGHLQMS